MFTTNTYANWSNKLAYISQSCEHALILTCPSLNPNCRFVFLSFTHLFNILALGHWSFQKHWKSSSTTLECFDILWKAWKFIEMDITFLVNL
jgi:hypothetical protein